eukprot:TRINITY_DN37271_c0_g2_i1.p1 TRINITY_DN37271_c0_g2~~TRINITY_DN37271_c0_g2_i1.p1  ORF type:complete len:726 (+),score=149.64 TRINITY_DN37271_c0_g2_i1:118-2178(+)
MRSLPSLEARPMEQRRSGVPLKRQGGDPGRFTGEISFGRVDSFEKRYIDEGGKMEEKLKAFGVTETHAYLRKTIEQSRWRSRADTVMEHAAYQLALALCTVTSVVLVALEADLQASGETSGSDLWFTGITIFVIFTADIVARIYTYRWHFVASVLNLLEAFLIILDIVLEFWPGLPNVAASLKVLRFLRLARILRSLSELRELYLMMMGMLASVRAIVFGSALLFMTLSMFSILAVYFVRPISAKLFAEGVYGDCSYCEVAFDTVMNSNLTLLTTIVAGDSWGRLAIPIAYADTGAAVVIVGALVVINLGLLNTIAAVIVDRQAQARVEDQDYMAVIQAEELRGSLDCLEGMFKEMDSSCDNTLSLNELLEHYDKNALFRSILNRLDVHKGHVPIVFAMLDRDNTQDLTFTEFVNGLHALRSDNSHTLAVFTNHYCEKLYNRWEDVEYITQLIERQDDKWDRQEEYFDRLSSLAARLEEHLAEVNGTPVASEPSETVYNTEKTGSQRDDPAIRLRRSCHTTDSMVQGTFLCTASSDAPARKGSKGGKVTRVSSVASAVSAVNSNSSTDSASAMENMNPKKRWSGGSKDSNGASTEAQSCLVATAAAAAVNGALNDVDATSELTTQESSELLTLGAQGQNASVFFGTPTCKVKRAIYRPSPSSAPSAQSASPSASSSPATVKEPLDC